MKWYGLTGGLGCGKSAVAEIIRQSGFPVVDADRMVHHLYDTDKNLHSQLVKEFGSQILQNGKIDRVQIASVLKSEPHKKKNLEQIVHPIIQAKVMEIRNRLQQNQAKMAFYDVPLLFENKLQDQFQATVFVNAPDEQVYERLLLRNSWSKAEVDQRLQWLLPNSEKIKLATYVIENDGSIAELEIKVKNLLAKLP
jgi:dephospho-CoA kinase